MIKGVYRHKKLDYYIFITRTDNNTVFYRNIHKSTTNDWHLGILECAMTVHQLLEIFIKLNKIEIVLKGLDAYD